MMLADESNVIVAANRAMCVAVGLAATVLIGRDLVEIVVPREAADFRRELRAVLRTGVSCSSEHELRDRAEDGRRAVAWSMTRTSRSPAIVACLGVDVTAARNDSDLLRDPQSLTN